MEEVDLSNVAIPIADPSLTTKRERRTTAQLRRYLVNEIRAVRFGVHEDCILSSLMLAIAILITHLPLYLFRRQVWINYANSNQYLVGMLLYCWILGYNTVSYVIYHQFERRETYSADDFYIVSNGGDEQTPEVIELPDGRFAIGTSTRV